MLGWRVLPVFAEAAQHVYHLRLGRLRGLHVAHHPEPFLLPGDALGVARLGILHHRAHPGADGLFLIAGEVAVDQPRVVHHLVIARFLALGRVWIQEFLAVLGIALGKFLFHAADLLRRQRQQQVGEVGHRLFERLARQLLRGILEVLDRGKGMNEAVLQNALMPFYSTKRNGTGLGLALTREIIEAHGGRISLQNRREGGLCVAIFLPA
ncbi:Sensor protein FixL [compost metagenome]